jgi:hypothetical protein
MKSWTVFFRISGHGSIEVDAENEDDAIISAAEVFSTADIDDWDIVKSSAEAKEEGDT